MRRKLRRRPVSTISAISLLSTLVWLSWASFQSGTLAMVFYYQHEREQYRLFATISAVFMLYCFMQMLRQKWHDPEPTSEQATIFYTFSIVALPALTLLWLKYVSSNASIMKMFLIEFSSLVTAIYVGFCLFALLVDTPFFNHSPTKSFSRRFLNSIRNFFNPYEEEDARSAINILSRPKNNGHLTNGNGHISNGNGHITNGNGRVKQILTGVKKDKQQLEHKRQIEHPSHSESLHD